MLWCLTLTLNTIYVSWCRLLQLVQCLRIPVVKFVAEATSFILFLCLILLHSYEKQIKLCDTRFIDDPQIRQHWEAHRTNLSAQYGLLDRMCVRHFHPSVLETLIMLWIAGRV